MKLLYLFLKRGIDVGYDFKLATERPDLGDKFDDLVFKFWPDPFNRSKFEIRFVQAKHKQSDSVTITAADLLNTTDEAFSLIKYFISFRHIWKENSEHLHDVVICCNAGFDLDSLHLKGFSLIPNQKSDKQVFTSDTTLNNLKLDETNVHVQELRVKLKQCSTTHLLADEILECFKNNTKSKLKLTNSWFKLYHFALVEEHVLVITVRQNGKAKEYLAEFHPDFKERRNFSLAATALYDILCKDSMWEKIKVAKVPTSSTFGRNSRPNKDHHS